MVAAELEGERVAAVERRGKYLIVRFESGRALLSHLRMTGAFLANGRTTSRRTRTGAPSSPRRRTASSYRDVRRFGTWLLLEPDEVEPYLGGASGVEPLGRGFTAAWLAAAARGPARPIKAALLDQRTVAGLGNIYADEALWRARIHPLRPAGELSPRSCAACPRAIRDALRHGIARQGATLRDYRRPDGSAGGMQHEFHVYGRDGEPCDRCGTPIEKIRVAGRGTWFCPPVRPADLALSRRSATIGGWRTHDDRDLTEATVTGLAWTAGNRIVQQAFLIVGTAVLARMLSPADFGLVAMTAIFLGFIAVISDFGLPAALVQRRELTRVQLSSAFWLEPGDRRGARGRCWRRRAAAGGPLRPVGAAQDHARARARLPIGALSAVQSGRAQRAMAFRRFAFIENLAVGLSYIAAIVAAALGAGVWSLVVLPLRARPRHGRVLDRRPVAAAREFDREAVRSLMHFGGNLAGASSIAYWINNADNLLVGIFSGGRSLGIYSRAFTLMQAPLAQVSWAAQRVMFPALTRIRDDVARMRRVYLRAISLIAFVAFPLAVVVASPPSRSS